MPDGEYLYLVISECPGCDAEVGHAKRFAAPIALDHEVPLSAKFCPQCGVEIAECEFGWTPVEDAEVARVLPTQEREATVFIDAQKTDVAEKIRDHIVGSGIKPHAVEIRGDSEVSPDA
jgi:hypothetical protein